ncbi:hypothetical protein AB0F46_39795 [Streptomyces sp. NPDC026665]|uniref:hypothetical protein n=1 Tax=Streptomyces sp. NPDC026665 TaxID=3154798 RepID=UPI0033E245F3
MNHELQASCDTCNAPVLDRQGILWIDMADVDRAVTDVQAWKLLDTEQETARDVHFAAACLMQYPKPARWQVHHTACNPSPRARSYAIEVHRCRSWVGLVWWTAHLMGTTWLQHTDWEQLLRETVEATGTRIIPAS